MDQQDLKVAHTTRVPDLIEFDRRPSHGLQDLGRDRIGLRDLVGLLQPCPSGSKQAQFSANAEAQQIAEPGNHHGC